MDFSPNTASETAIAAAIEDGSYFTSAKRWYGAVFHTPIAERSYFIIIILLGLVNTYFTIVAFLAVFPISNRVPFYAYSEDVWTELPRISRISTSKHEDKNLAVMKFMVKNYLTNRESYDLKSYEMRYRNIWSHSDKSVFERYAAFMDASNPYGPYQQYSNRQKRVIKVVAEEYSHKPSTDPAKAGMSRARIIYDDSVLAAVSNQEISHSRWQADIAYSYTDFDVDQSLEKHVWIAQFLGLTGDTLSVNGQKRNVVPMTFKVQDYRVKQLLE